ncbi:suppressor of mec-8 and unc-52 protein [Artemisia annua]|uniref:Suppressor of mec-8 and unc-52 protein n=1 Tax=Artemisia annua TaxID=35608 RepID=A0A2U1KDT9_ARTAN|nr:suppressor of mec-8 and unc-52 protein [Artemisia annua]
MNGEGGFGGVYKGWIDETTLAPARPNTGQVVAIKVLKSESHPAHREWLARITTSAQVLNFVHMLDFDTKEEWETYNKQKEALPKAAFQFGVKMQDGRNTRKHNKDSKITN